MQKEHLVHKKCDTYSLNSVPEQVEEEDPDSPRSSRWKVGVGGNEKVTFSSKFANSWHKYDHCVGFLG